MTTKRKATTATATTTGKASASTGKGKAATKTDAKVPQRALGKLTASAPVAKKAKPSRDVFDFPEDDGDQESMTISVKWVKSGSGAAATEWDFKVPLDATVASLRVKVDDSTDSVFKDHAVIFKYKSKTLSDLRAQLSEYGIAHGSEVLLLINPESTAGVELPPTMVQHNEFPGAVPQKAKKQKSNTNASGVDKKRERFSREEADDLVRGVELYGLGQWAQIRTSYFQQTTRTGVDLKDKWRNLVTAAARSPGFKFRVDYLNDPSFLARVRAVNEEANKMPASIL